MDAVRWRESEAFDGYGSLHAIGIEAGIKQSDHAAERVPDQVDGKFSDHVGQRGKIQDIFGNAVHRAGRPVAVAVAAQIHGVDVKMFPEDTRYPIPVARVIETAVHQHKRGLAVLSPIPEVQLQAMRIEVVRDRFQSLIVEGAGSPAAG